MQSIELLFLVREGDATVLSFFTDGECPGAQVASLTPTLPRLYWGT